MKILRWLQQHLGFGGMLSYPEALKDYDTSAEEIAALQKRQREIVARALALGVQVDVKARRTIDDTDYCQR